ncbi:gp53-like domain-containing protein [Enterobacter soli]
MTGKVGTTNGGARITFPFAFASKCYSIHLNAVASSGAGTALAYYNEDTTGFNLQIAGGGAVAFAWTAEGI